jgi:hypothetical protein
MAIKEYQIDKSVLTQKEINEYEFSNRKAKFYLRFQIFVYLLQITVLLVSLLTGYYYKVRLFTTIEWFDKIDFESFEKPIVKTFGAPSLILSFFFIIWFFFLIRSIKTKKKTKTTKIIKFFFITFTLIINFTYIFIIAWLLLYLPWELNFSIKEFSFSLHKRMLNLSEIQCFIKKYCTLFEISLTDEIYEKIRMRLYSKFPDPTKITVKDLLFELKSFKEELDFLAKQEAERKALELQQKAEEKMTWYQYFLNLIGLQTQQIDPKEIFIFITLFLSLIGLFTALHSYRAIKTKDQFTYSLKKEPEKEDCVYNPEDEKLFEETEFNFEKVLPEEEKEFQLILRETTIEEEFEPILKDSIVSNETPTSLRRYLSAQWAGTPVRKFMSLWDPWDKMGGVYSAVTDEFKLHYPAGSPFFGNNRKEGGIAAEILKEDKMTVFEYLENQKKGLKILQEELDFKISLQIQLLEKKEKDILLLRLNNFEIQDLMREIASFHSSVEQLSSLLNSIEYSLINTTSKMEDNHSHPYFNFFEDSSLYKNKYNWAELSHVPKDAREGTLYDRQLRPDTWDLWRDEQYHQSVTPKIWTIKYGEQGFYVYKHEVQEILKKGEEIRELEMKEYNNSPEYHFFKESIKIEEIIEEEEKIEEKEIDEEEMKEIIEKTPILPDHSMVEPKNFIFVFERPDAFDLYNMEDLNNFFL